ncbi:hypothetical protein WICMUC_004444 [Wickerhamomyces mucosus]|uniref:Uncharacterized protein n=1 Tax=Wickerhamomyces mucosus TaxID=1378264 RepID=A0A9P8TAY0_9ASCO|nr:hypothetical protein WICMUC_004444 [Wickerhamomyces mucosus]
MLLRKSLSKNIIIRFHSSSHYDLSQIKNLLKTPEVLIKEQSDISIYFSDLFIDLNQQSNISKDNLSDLHNLVLQNFLKYEPSLSTIHQNHLRKLGRGLNVESLVEIIKHNSGRVHSSWEIFTQKYKELKLYEVFSDDLQNLLTVVLEKLINGDINRFFDDEELELEELSHDDLIKSTFLLKNIKNPFDGFLVKILQRAIDLRDYKLLEIIGIPTFEHFSQLTFNDPKAEIFAYNLISKGEQPLDYLSNLLLKLNDHTDLSLESISDSSTQWDKLNAQFPNLSTSYPTNELLIHSRKLFDRVYSKFENSPIKSISTKCNVLKSIGFKKGSSISEIKKTFEELNTENSKDLQTTLLSILSYHAYISKSDILFNQVKELSKSLCNFKYILLLYPKFENIESALSLFNNELQTPDSIKSLIIAYLINEDREFANLIFNGSINAALINETQKADIKQYFKRFGDILGEEERFKRDKLMDEWVLEIIKNL